MSEAQLQTILVVETDSDVQALIRRILETPGRQVLIATTESEAIRLGSSNHIDLLLTEVVLPGVGGPELAKQLQLVQPGLQVVFMSGWHDHPSFPRPNGGRLLEKPFSSDELRQAIAHAIEGLEEA
jgi:two-component system cell cycle sensor histidine kinase/response regulator CckA